MKRTVAPFMGAWIETPMYFGESNGGRVAPFMGAWIETATWVEVPTEDLVAPFMGAWIETYRKKRNVRTILSHPSWVRGLKRRIYRRCT